MNAAPRRPGALGKLKLNGVTVISGVILLGACCCTKSPEPQKLTKQEFTRQDMQFVQTYLTGSLAQASQSISNDIELCQTWPNLEAEFRAQLQFVNYSRAYVLFLKSGDQNRADIALIKARYWNVVRYELGSGGLTAEGTSFNDPHKILVMIEEFDKHLNGGKEPKYANQLPPQSKAP